MARVRYIYIIPLRVLHNHSQPTLGPIPKASSFPTADPLPVESECMSTSVTSLILLEAAEYSQGQLQTVLGLVVNKHGQWTMKTAIKVFLCFLVVLELKVKNLA